MSEGYELDRPGREAVLPGEMPDSDVRDDAEHWVAVYEELIGFLVGSQAADGALPRYRHRLSFWRSRRDQLANGHSPEAGS